MGKEKQVALSAKDQDVAALLSKLHLTKHSQLKHSSRNHGLPALPLRKPISRKNELFQTMLLDISPGDQMQVDSTGQKRDEADMIDYPMLLQISDLLRSTSVTDDSPALPNSSRTRMKSYISLLRSCGLTAEYHYLYLKHWQGMTSRFLSSPVFDCHSFWSHHILNISVPCRILHCAILAVSALQYTRLNEKTSYGRTSVTAAYRLRAEAERRLRYHNNEEDHEVTVASHVCLLLFDYLSGNQEEWLSRILLTKIAMRSARYSSSHPTGRYFFWIVAHHDRLSMHIRSTPSVLDVDDLIWDEAIHLDISDAGLPGRIDSIGLLFAKLMQISTHARRLNHHSSEDQFDAVDFLLMEWKEGFPIDLQTYSYTGEVYDASCFLHSLTCNGGPRAIALHCLFSEIMILRLSFAIEFQKAKIHEHAMTICRLVQSLTTPADLIHNGVANNLCIVLGSLFVAGHHLFSKDGKSWLKRLFEWIASISGNLGAEKMTEILELFWREFRTRPKTICLTEEIASNSDERRSLTEEIASNSDERRSNESPADCDMANLSI